LDHSRHIYGHSILAIVGMAVLSEERNGALFGVHGLVCSRSA
jgi:hypothetical protein